MKREIVLSNLFNNNIFNLNFKLFEIIYYINKNKYDDLCSKLF